MPKHKKTLKPPAGGEYFGPKDFIIIIVIVWPLAVLYQYALHPDDPNPSGPSIAMVPMSIMFLFAALLGKLIRPAAYHHLSVKQRNRRRVLVIALHILAYEGSGHFFDWSGYWMIITHVFNVPTSVLLIVQARKAAAHEPELLPDYAQHLDDFNDNELYGRRLIPGGKRYWWW